MKVKIKVLSRIPRTMKYVQSGIKLCDCEEVSRETVLNAINRPSNWFMVRLSEDCAGYKVGHVLRVPESDLIVS